MTDTDEARGTANTNDDVDVVDPPHWDWYLGPRVWLPGLALLVLAMIGSAAGWWITADESAAADPGAPVLAADGTLRQPVHWHTDFAVFIRGQQFNFAQDDFWSKEGEEKDPYVHIHEPRSTVIHVHREQTTWDEFLNSLGFQLTDNSLTLPDGTKYVSGNGETLKFFVNGTRVDTLMFQDITDLGKVLITFGSESDEDILRTQWPTVTDQACIPSELCKDRIPDEPEPEPCSKSGTSCTG